MKRYLYLVLVALIATTPLSFGSCSSDDDEKGDEQKGHFPYENYLNGEISVYHEYADNERVYYSLDADYTHLYQHREGGNSLNGYTFYTVLSYNFNLEEALEKANGYDNKYWSTDWIWAIACADYSKQDWQFQTKGEIHEGDEIYLTAIFWDDHLICKDQDGGKVYVKSIEDDTITLNFQDLKFQRCRTWKVGSSEFEQLTVNGEISFTASE